MKLVNIGNVTVDTKLNDTIEFRDALCKYTDPEIFFPATRNNNKDECLNENNKTAIEICKKCNHEIDCAAYAIIRPNLYGIWGGLTNTDRQRIRKKYGITGLTDTSLSDDDINSN
jgi:WhiB family redox-sensing transcriptional regulator